jgi:hypothetical protein
VLQHSSTKKATTTVVAFFLLWSCIVAQLHEEGDGICRRLLPTVELRCSAVEEGNSVVELRYSATEEGDSVMEQRSEAGDDNNAAIAFFSLF